MTDAIGSAPGRDHGIAAILLCYLSTYRRRTTFQHYRNPSRAETAAAWSVAGLLIFQPCQSRRQVAQPNPIDKPRAATCGTCHRCLRELPSRDFALTPSLLGQTKGVAAPPFHAAAAIRPLWPTVRWRSRGICRAAAFDSPRGTLHARGQPATVMSGSSVMVIRAFRWTARVQQREALDGYLVLPVDLRVWWCVVLFNA